MKQRIKFEGAADDRCVYCLSHSFHYQHEHDRSILRREGKLVSEKKDTLLGQEKIVELITSPPHSGCSCLNCFNDSFITITIGHWQARLCKCCALQIVTEIRKVL